jgi:hypothetical protein
VRTKLLGLALLAVACLALPVGGTATASAAEPVEPTAGLSFEAELPTTEGWTIYLRGVGPHYIELDIESAGSARRLTTMTYATGGRIGPDGIEADLGRFGQVDLHFAAPPRKSYLRFPDCGGSYREVIRSGTLTGTVEFAPLAGPSKVDLESVEGEISGPTLGVCKPRQIIFGGPETRPPSTRPATGFESPSEDLVARRRSNARTLDLSVFRIVGKVVDLAASSTRNFGKVTVQTTVHAPKGRGLGEAATLTTTGRPERPTGATLRARSPFSGVGIFRARPGVPPTWRGSFAVTIPGEGHFHLAGPGFSAVVCGYEETLRQRDCERTVAIPQLL